MRELKGLAVLLRTPRKGWREGPGGWVGVGDYRKAVAVCKLAVTMCGYTCAGFFENVIRNVAVTAPCLPFSCRHIWLHWHCFSDAPNVRALTLIACRLNWAP